jgi:hypothetical protein
MSSISVHSLPINASYRIEEDSCGGWQKVLNKFFFAEKLFDIMLQVDVTTTDKGVLLWNGMVRRDLAVNIIAF